MPFLILGDEVSLHKALGTFKDADGKILGYDHDSVTRFKDEIVADEDISPVVIGLYDSGEAHIRSLIVRVDGDGTPVDVPVETEPVYQEAIVSKAGTGEHTVTPTTEPIAPVKKPAAEVKKD